MNARNSASLGVPQFILERCYSVTDAAALQSFAAAQYQLDSGMESLAMLVEIFGEPDAPSLMQTAAALSYALESSRGPLPGVIEQSSHVVPLDPPR